MSVVSAVDGKVPIYEPDALWKMWSLSELWLGPNSPGKDRYVPKIHDYVINPETFETWEVVSLDTTTLVPTLKARRPFGMTFELDEEDILFGVHPGFDGETWRGFLNTSVTPHTLTLDSRLRINGSLASYAKIFIGADTTAATGKVISKMYDANGNFVSSNIPLELVALDGKTNYAVRSVKRCFVDGEYKDNELMTIVVYSDDSQVVTKRQFLIENTDTMANVEDGIKYIKSIDLESIWLSATSPDVIEYPLNIPMNALNLIGVVTYSDGTTLREAVGANKFQMFGLDGHLSSIPGQPHDLVLKYRASDSEVSLVPLAKAYSIVNTNPNNSIAVKLFGYPFWVSEVTGYQMRWYMLNLTRNVFFEVTNHVEYTESTGPFDPLKYGYLQRKQVSINLRNVSGSFIPFVHTQVVDIVLNGPATNELVDAWTIGTESSETYPRFGVGVYGKVTGGLVNMGAGFTNYDEWIEAFYRKTLPLVNTDEETKAPDPTHFIVSYKGVNTEWSMDYWNKELAINTGAATGKTTATIRFIKRTASGDLNLSYAAVLLKEVA